MTRLFNEPENFVDEMMDGFAAAASRWVQQIPGGVVRVGRPAKPTVSLVIGGGSGHYPAFGGLVGPGLAHGAVMGNLFASPSAHQVRTVARTADQGRGVLLSYGNYAGDVLHFDEAQAELREAGMDVRTVTVTDDIISAPRGEEHKRRGIAGDLTVFKVAGAACEVGYDLDGVERVARRANDRTRSLGVAFGGCTLPGADAPLFEVPAGRMAVGLGIHGEPGIDEVDIPTAAGLAELFVSSLLEEVPDGVDLAGARVVPLLNGLGSVKYEELFVVYRTVHALLAARGISIVDPEVGELCTSFDMAGCSLTLLWLDEELERLWTAPADTPGFRRGQVGDQQRFDAVVKDDAEEVIGSSTAESRACAATIVTALEALARTVDEHADELGRLDQVAGDGDHGIGMQRGAHAGRDAARAAVEQGAGAETALRHAANAWSDRAGGTSGAIWATMLKALGTVVGDDARPTPKDLARGISAARDAVMAFGKAKVGDKTMVDAVVPFSDELSTRVGDGSGLAEAWAGAAAAATAAAEATASMRATLGRARSHGEKSVGTPDPGAVSFALICTTVSDVIRNAPGARPDDH
ncbi:D-erythrulose kinase [Arthrobacter agilis]|uniref:D-erythrulose kinase n=1 Tax=Arthrobacter agilis TaxID=37921 RepID=A0A2L0UHJ0_9MICC|nr:dihydroxyacetone kinase family protein [Arthrobacter agilis]AUZ88678.1 D-erythrulose kinase [Arthrobacter agilis]